MLSAYEHVRLCHEQLMKLQVICLEDLVQNFLIEIVQEEYSDLTSHSCHILYDLIGLCLSYAEIIFILAISLYQVDKCIHRK